MRRYGPVKFVVLNSSTLNPVAEDDHSRKWKWRFIYRPLPVKLLFERQPRSHLLYSSDVLPFGARRYSVRPSEQQDTSVEDAQREKTQVRSRQVTIASQRVTTCNLWTPQKAFLRANTLWSDFNNMQNKNFSLHIPRLKLIFRGFK